MKKKAPLLGAHMSIEGGIQNAYYRAAQIGCTTFQLFTHSNRQWGIKPISQATLDAVAQAQKETGLTHTMVHASYLINLASESSDTALKSVKTLQMELEHCSRLKIPYLVLHPGSNKDHDYALKQIAHGLDTILREDRGSTMILLENTAGQGTQVGSTFEQLAHIRKSMDHKNRIGFCIDTCHLWASGYDFSTPEAYKKLWKEWDALCGLSHLKALHMNDSKQKRGSHVDRHEEIGKGTIGIEGFRLIMNDKNLQNVAKVLETPNKELAAYAHNMKILSDLIA